MLMDLSSSVCDPETLTAHHSVGRDGMYEAKGHAKDFSVLRRGRNLILEFGLEPGWTRQSTGLVDK